MPKRKRTRAQERQQLINQARMLNEETIASEEWHRYRELEMAHAAEEWDEPAPF